MEYLSGSNSGNFSPFVVKYDKHATEAFVLNRAVISVCFRGVYVSKDDDDYDMIIFFIEWKFLNFRCVTTICIRSLKY